MKIESIPTLIPGTVGAVIIRDVDMKLAQTVPIKFPSHRGVQFIPRRAGFVTKSVDTLSNGASVSLLEGTGKSAVAASLSTALTGTHNDLDFTAKVAGLAGNDITIAYTNPATPSAALGVVLTGKDIVVNLATGAGTAQVETATAAGTITTAGNVDVTITSAILTGSPLTITVPVALNDTANEIALAIRTALAANGDVAAKFIVSGATDEVILTTRAAFVAANDATLNIAIIDGTSVGVTTAASSANTTAGIVAAITSTAALIEAALEADAEVMELITVANKSANDGSGIVTALAETNLASGVDYATADTLSSSADLADIENVGLIQELTLVSDKEAIEGGNLVALVIGTGATATTHKADFFLEYLVL